MNKKLTVALAGLGARGADSYAPAALKFPDLMEIVAISDIDPEKVASVAKTYNIPQEACYDSAESMLEAGKLADVMFIATQDKQHVGHAIPALKLGYHLLLEKPISPDLDECRELLKVATEEDRLVVVCHVLRYTPFFTKVKELLDSGIIGEITTVAGFEYVQYWHQAHSFVRGNWRNSIETSPMILQKCCHDMDLYLWLTGKTVKSVSSFGNTFLFKEENAPAGCTKRCLDGCAVKDSCLFDAEAIYMDSSFGIRNGHTKWPVNVVSLNPTENSVYEALKAGPYGRCVYHCDNDVVDHQIVNLEMTDGSLISFTMSAFTAKQARESKIMGTKGEIIGLMEENIIKIRPFGKEEIIIDVNLLATDFSGHGGGDHQMVKEFLQVVAGEIDMPPHMTSLDVSVESHYIALAAEVSRLAGGKVVKVSDMR